MTRKATFRLKGYVTSRKRQLAEECPICGSKPGRKCTDYRGRGKAACGLKPRKKYQRIVFDQGNLFADQGHELPRLRGKRGKVVVQ